MCSSVHRSPQPSNRSEFGGIMGPTVLVLPENTPRYKHHSSYRCRLTTSIRVFDSLPIFFFFCPQSYFSLVKDNVVIHIPSLVTSSQKNMTLNYFQMQSTKLMMLLPTWWKCVNVTACKEELYFEMFKLQETTTCRKPDTVHRKDPNSLGFLAQGISVQNR